ncbi:MAG: DUF6599 family protein [Acidobacteriota bacterium]
MKRLVSRMYSVMVGERLVGQVKRRVLRKQIGSGEGICCGVFLLIIAIVALWVVMRGRRSDASLFASGDARLAHPTVGTVYKRPTVRLPEAPPASGAPLDAGVPSSVPQPALQSTTPAAPPIGLFPGSVVTAGWRIGTRFQEYDQTNLFEKIDGRESFYFSYDFKRLSCMALETDAGVTIDLEAFDLGTPESAAGALLAEHSGSSAKLDVDSIGLRYATSGAAFFARGRYYCRIVGSDDSAAVSAKVAQIAGETAKALPPAALPREFLFLIDRMRVPAAGLGFFHEAGLGFDFGRDVFVGQTADAELFLVRSADAQAAAELAKRFLSGFASSGEAIENPRAGGRGWFKNRYEESVETAVAVGRYAAGVRKVKDVEAGEAVLAKLIAELEKLDDGG